MQITLKNLKRDYGSLHAVDGVSLEIPSNTVYGIIGRSGAGKSTLVRLVSMLETPDQGEVWYGDKRVDNLSREEMIQERRKIGMIFQNFNLFSSRTAAGNIAYPMEICRKPKEYIRKRTEELLALVGLEGRGDAPVSTLSGGQKQRIAIARALASEPSILFCDEATSALDPQTTKSILQLLKEINQKYGITIVVITHEMAVVQEICSHVAIIDHGKLAEHGTVEQIFQAPKSKEAKKLIYQGYEKVALMKGKRCVRIVFSENSSFEPVIANMVLAFKTPVNILYANTKDLDGVATGEMILQLPEDDVLGDKMIAYLKNTKLTVEELEDYVG